MESRTRILNPFGRYFVKVKWSAPGPERPAGGRLTITAVDGPLRNGDCVRGCGQCKEPLEDDARTCRPGWTMADRLRLLELWDRWHLNDMRPGCEHQRDQGWDQRRIDETMPDTSYGLHFEGQKSRTWNLLVEVMRDEHPRGLLCEPCPECGYRYGTGWLCEAVPDEVLEELFSFPETTINPAWI